MGFESSSRGWVPDSGLVVVNFWDFVLFYLLLKACTPHEIEKEVLDLLRVVDLFLNLFFEHQ